MMSMSSEKFLVTGANGWLGRGILDALVFGLPQSPALKNPVPASQIRVLILPNEEGESLKKTYPGITVVHGDLRKTEDCERFTANSAGSLLIHAAGIIHPSRVREFFDINLTGAKNLLKAAEHSEIKRAVMVSSNSPCGTNPHPDHLFDEESPYHPYMNYGRSKMMMEKEVRRVQESGKLETVIIRAPWFYGPNQPKRQTLFFKMIRDGKVPIVGSGNNLRSMAYTENLSQGILLAAITPKAAGGLYWIADERPYSMNEIVQTVRKVLDQDFGLKCKPSALRLPSVVSEVAWGVDAALQKFGLYHQKIHVLSEMNKTIACSVKKAVSELGYTPHVALEEGMRRSLNWIMKDGGTASLQLD